MGLENRIPTLVVAWMCGIALGGDAALISAIDITDRCGIDARYTTPHGVGISTMISGAAIEDFNRDGWMDIYFLGGAQRRDALYICLGPDKNGDIRYEDQGESWGILEPQIGAGVSVADYDGNGYPDVYVTAHGNSNSLIPGQHRLYRNSGPDSKGQFRFDEVAGEAGIAMSAISAPDGFSSSWGDIDLDGDLDLIVGGWIENSGGNKLFRNNSDGTFTDITEDAIDIDLIDTHGFTPRIIDVTSDGAPEILISADYNTSKLLFNDGNGRFTDITQSAGVNHDSNGMGGTTADYNNDGKPDWYVSSIKSGNSIIQNGNKLYMNLGDGVFQENAINAGVDDGGWGWGTVSGDLDHDGDIDIVETNGWIGSQWLNEQSYIFMNDGDGSSFTEQAIEIGVDNHGLGRGAILFDHDNDGDLDLAFVSADIRFTLFRNDASEKNTNRWVRITLDTSESPANAPGGVGAELILTTGETTQHRWMQANSGYLSQGPIEVHAGLGATPMIDQLEIRWANGAVRVIEDLPVDAQYRFVPCDGDMNGDHIVAHDDIMPFVLSFFAGHRHTDLDANSVHDIFDVIAFIDAYNNGCPSDG